MPDRNTEELVQRVHERNGQQRNITETGDWRGNFSVYRTYCYDIGTMNFNHWNSAGTLLGGASLGSER